MKDFSMGSKRENAREITVKVTKGKIFVFFLVCVLFGWAVAYVVADDIKDLYEAEIKIQCSSGAIEIVEYGKEYYCTEHYTTLEGKVKNYNKLKEIVENE